MEHLQYPIGKFNKDKTHTLEENTTSKDYLGAFPDLLIALTENLTNEDLSKAYRSDGWNIRQLVHHIADSHANMYIRFKWALTEENPTIKGYNEAVWAELSDSKMPIQGSLEIIKGLHQRIVYLIENMKPEDFDRSYFHAGYQRVYLLKNVIPLYEWHSRHHLEHIKIALNS